MIAISVDTHRLAFLPTPVSVYRITAEWDLVPAAEVTVRDLHGLMVWEKANDPQAQVGI